MESKKSSLKKSKGCIELKLSSPKKLVTRISTGIIKGNINTGANIALAFKLNVSEATIKQMLNIIGVPMSIEKNSKNNIHEVFDSVKNKTCDYGIVPVENSNQGSIKSTLDFLIKYKVNICGEQNIPIKHCLMSQSSSVSGIKKIYSGDIYFGS